MNWNLFLGFVNDSYNWGPIFSETLSTSSFGPVPVFTKERTVAYDQGLTIELCVKRFVNDTDTFQSDLRPPFMVLSPYSFSVSILPLR